MDETTRDESASSTTGLADDKRGRGVPWGVFIGLLVVAFAAGFLWQFYEASTVREELSVVERELVLERLRIRLGQAALAAQSGDFEAARSQMSRFFTQLEESSPAMTEEVRGVAENFLNMRDEVITGLSRSNPEYAGVLYGMLEQLGTAIDQSLGRTPAGGMPTGGGALPPVGPEATGAEGQLPAEGNSGSGAVGGTP